MVESTENYPNSIIIEKATSADLPAIEKILRATVQNPYGSGNVDEREVKEELEKIRQSLDSPEHGQTLIARGDQDDTLGFAFFDSPDPRIIDLTGSDPDTTLELKLLYLDPSVRRRG